MDGALVLSRPPMGFALILLSVVALGFFERRVRGGDGSRD
jgi:hypothetical protein